MSTVKQQRNRMPFFLQFSEADSIDCPSAHVLGCVVAPSVKCTTRLHVPLVEDIAWLGIVQWKLDWISGGDQRELFKVIEGLCGGFDR